MKSSLGTNRVARFIWLAGKELIPEPVKLPATLAKHFRDCFFVTSPQERLALYSQLAEADEKATREIEELIRQEWENILPAGRHLPPGTTAVVRGLVDSLRAAGQEKTDDAQLASLEGALGSHVLHAGETLPPTKLNPQQVQLGRLVVSSALRSVPDIGPGPTPFPQIPGYEIKRFLKQGGFGRVYVAYHEETKSLRAVKVGDAHKRLPRELGFGTQFNSPHLVRYLENGWLGDGRYWIAMDYLSEQSLGEMLAAAGGRCDPELALVIGEQVLTGLKALHDKGVIHRDLTPNNVMADSSFRLRLIDFGLARPLATLDGGTGTTTGSIVGTPFYMSPEQLRGDEVTLATDVYSFGVLMYRLFTGTEPFRGANVVALALAIERESVDLKRAGIPADLRDFLGRCLDKDPARRPPHGKSALKAFDKVAAALRRQFRYERFAAGWKLIFERKAIPRFVEQHEGWDPKDPAASARAFTRWAAEQGIAEVDEERIAQAFPAVFATRAATVRAKDLLTRATKLRADITASSDASPKELGLLNGVVKARSEVVARSHKTIDAKVREVLHAEDVASGAAAEAHMPVAPPATDEHAQLPLAIEDILSPPPPTEPATPTEEGPLVWVAGIVLALLVLVTVLFMIWG